jgi:hypothetical protein
METFDPRVEYNRTNDTAVKYTGPNVPSLEIKTNENLSVVISKVAKAIDSLNSLKARVSELETLLSTKSSDIKADSLIYDLIDQAAVVTAGLNDKSIKLDVLGVSSTGNKTEFSFDMNEIFNNLDSKYVPVGIDTNIRSYDSANRLLASSSSRAGKLEVANTTGPFMVTSKVNLRSPEGDIYLSKTFYVPTVTPTQMSGKPTVSGTEISDVKEFTQKQYNEVLASNISKLSQVVANIEKNLAL